MKYLKKLIFLIVFSFGSLFVVFAGNWWNSEKWNCIELNTNVPFIWNKICTDWSANNWEGTNVTADNAFPVLVWWLSKIVMGIIIAVAFLMVIIWWVMITSSWADQSLYWRWRDLIIKAIIWIALLWLSWIILHAINPNFFK